MKKRFLSWLILLLFPFISITAQEEQPDHPLTAIDTLSTDFGLFTKDDILNITLRFDITTYRRKKPKEEYMDALLTYHLNDRDSINKKIKLKSRGEMRNGYCDFPPIRLNFTN